MNHMKVDLSGGKRDRSPCRIGEEFQVAPRARNLNFFLTCTSGEHHRSLELCAFLFVFFFFFFCAENTTFGIHLTIYIPCRHIT